tara:strand:+ start:9180 stop:9425 length:246 start_codon:yes stop_codon:yes gene_type:complete
MSWEDILKADKEKTLINRLKDMAKKTGKTVNYLLMRFIVGKDVADYVRETGFKVGQFTEEEKERLESYTDDIDPLYMPDDF